jgi:HSP20 family protein
VFTRTLQLPDDADPDHIHASYQDGVLRIEIPKKPETKPKTIEIHG